MDISIFGLGYVGTVCAGTLASEGHRVIGVDVNPMKVEEVKSGSPPIVEPGLPELFTKLRSAGNLSATISAAEAIASSDISLVCVGTPSQPNGDLDLTYTERVCEEIGQALRAKSSPHVVVFRSTMLPGSTEQRLIPVLERASGRQVGPSLKVCYNPEFLREGSSVEDFYHPPKIVVGEPFSGAGDDLLELYRGIEAPVVRTSIPIAEMVKYCDNAFHALKVGFANEIGNICKEAGIDSHAVMGIFCQDTKLNLSRAYLKPGFSFGGSCLPKDLRALTYQARRFDLESPILQAILASNRNQTQRGIQAIMRTGRKRVGFLGMAFKANTDDLRESPLVEVIETLLGKGYQVLIYDRSVSTSRLIGANKRFIEDHIPHLSALLIEDPQMLLDQSDVVVLGHSAPEFTALLPRLRSEQVLIDLARGADPAGTPARYEGLCW